MNEKEYLDNLPETARNYFEAFLKDESWTWSGFAECLVRNYPKSDIEELYYFLGESLNEG